MYTRVGFVSEPKETRQKVFIYFDKAPEIGITKSELDKELNQYVVSDCLSLKKINKPIKSLIDLILSSPILPMEIYLVTDDLTYRHILESLHSDSRFLENEDEIYITVEYTNMKEFKDFDARIYNIQSYLNNNENIYICKEKKLEKHIKYGLLNKTIMDAEGISFLLAVEELTAPSYQEIADLNFKYARNSPFPFSREITLNEVLSMFERRDCY